MTPSARQLGGASGGAWHGPPSWPAQLPAADAETMSTRSFHGPPARRRMTQQSRTLWAGGMARQSRERIGRGMDGVAWMVTRPGPPGAVVRPVCSARPVVYRTQDPIGDACVDAQPNPTAH